MVGIGAKSRDLSLAGLKYLRKLLQANHINKEDFVKNEKVSSLVNLLGAVNDPSVLEHALLVIRALSLDYEQGNVARY